MPTYDSAETLLRSLVAGSGGKNVDDAGFGREMHKRLLEAAKVGGFTRGRELRATIHAARKLAQEAAQHINPDEAAAIIADGAAAPPPPGTLDMLVQLAVSAAREHDLRMEDGALADLLCGVIERHRLPRQVQDVLAICVAEFAIRLADADWTERFLERLRTDGREG